MKAVLSLLTVAFLTSTAAEAVALCPDEAPSSTLSTRTTEAATASMLVGQRDQGRIQALLGQADSRGLRCRRIQRAAQGIMAANGQDALRAAGDGQSHRFVKKPRKLIRRLLGTKVSRRDVSSGCYRCIARQLREGTPLQDQTACGLHDPCIAGGALSPTDDPCAGELCPSDPACCTSAWDDDCVTKASETCDLQCETCSHDVCHVGFALDTSCGTCAADICAIDPFCCDTLWSAECVARVQSVCGFSCLDGGPTSTLPGGSTTTTPEGPTTTALEGPTTTVSSGATTTTPEGPTTTVSSSPGATLPPPGTCTDVIDFSSFQRGAIVSEIQTTQGIVAVKGTNSMTGCGSNKNSAIIYDSSCQGGCSGDCNDFGNDFGTPNEAFGGPGEGSGGASGPYRNDTALNQILIIAQNLTDQDKDGRIDNPTVQANHTVQFEFDFSSFAPTSVLGLTLMDIDCGEDPAEIELFNSLGSKILHTTLASTGNNGVANLDLPANEDVWRLVVTLHGTGAIDNIRLGCSGGTTTTTQPSATTTTVSGQTTTTVAGATTTTVIGGGTTTTVPGGATTTLPTPTTTIGGGTTTTIGGGATTTIGQATTTTTGAATTTTLPVVGQCPDSVDLELLAGTGQPCGSNSDCPAGTCQSGRCRTVTELDTGWTGIAHDSDITDNVLLKGDILCPGSGPACGQCNVEGLDPEPRNCRCANNNQTICTQPFAADQTECGGAVCNCYLGPPLALSSGNTPACIVNRLGEDVSGTTNVDTGSSSLVVRLRSVVYLGESLVEPCPYCQNDPTPNDGQRGGKCVLGPNAGQDCDSNGTNRTFPAPGGGGHSLDCFPSPGKNVSGSGLNINLSQSTGSLQLDAAIPCSIGNSALCHCGLCAEDKSVACSSNADCSGGTGTCAKNALLDPLPNQCDTACSDSGDGISGVCDGPTDHSCDAIVRANGVGFIQCQTNADCAAANIGIDAGSCSLTKTRPCFLPKIVAAGKADPTTPVGAGIFCIPPTANGGINSVAGLPGPARILSQARTTARCGTAAYVPGVGCP